MFFRAQTLVRLGRKDDALKALDEVEAAYRTDAVLYKVYLASVALVRAEWSWRTGDATGARRLVDELLKDWNPAAATPSPALRRVFLLAAELALAQAEPAAAVIFAQAAGKEGTAAAADPTRSAHVGQAMLLLARAQRALGRQDQALQNLSGAIVALGNGLGEDHATVASARILLAEWKTTAAASQPGR
jgi:tetratricopeptide (TPR) repeat protein